jgi:hypothetical protein
VPYDAFGSGSVRACRVTRVDNNLATVCAPAGVAPKDAWCLKDADCSPGLACVGYPAARCLPYCCDATPDHDPCHDDGRSYCTPLPTAENKDDKVPVCVVPDDCTLLADPDDKCQAGTTCTVVTKWGDTSCVPVGPGLDLDCCNDDPCQRGYVCLGPSGDRHCRKLCHDGNDKECASGSCQKASTIPTGFGICSVGDAGASDASHTCK